MRKWQQELGLHSTKTKNVEDHRNSPAARRKWGKPSIAVFRGIMILPTPEFSTFASRTAIK